MGEENNIILNEADLEEVNGGVGGIMVIPYVVQKGDTFRSVAAKFNTTVTQIKKDNVAVLKGSKYLRIGMLLQIAKNSKKK